MGTPPFSPPAPAKETLRGTVQRIVFCNEENQYMVLRMSIRGIRGPITVVGNFLSPQPGEDLELEGQWSEHPRYGRQFQTSHYTRTAPSTLVGIRKYLGSGLIAGIGPKLAERITRHFGLETLRVIEESPERLQEVEGISKKRAAWICRAWKEQKDINEVMVFLQGHEISTIYAVKIYKRYGQQSIALVRANPYRLAEDIWGIGFKSADKIAQTLGIPRDSPARAQAALLHYLRERVDDGHVFYPQTPLLQECSQELEVPLPLLEEALLALTTDDRLVVEPLLTGDYAVYTASLAASERGAARRVVDLIRQPLIDFQGASRQLPTTVRTQDGLLLARAQQQAVEMALQHRLSIITGGPGTGKTTIIRSITRLLGCQRARILLAAPTGRAAKRLAEATGLEAKTLHRLLEYSPSEHQFQRDYNSPLKAEMIIVDEVSMLDIFLFHALLKAIPDGAQLVLVGDVDQLPSVGPGTVLRDLIDSKAIPVTRLTQIFRQEEGGLIVENAHRINQGAPPFLPTPPPNQLLDFYFIPQEIPAKAAQTIIELVCRRIPQRFGYDPLQQIQVLSPMHRGDVGVQHLNRRLQEALNPHGAPFTRAGRTFRQGDRVLQTRNNYDKDVFNGDIGCIEGINTEDHLLKVRFENRLVEYHHTELDDLTLAYAVSVHKSQGSEYPAVVIPLLTQHYMLLQRNLLYTAITRGKGLVVLVGTHKALHIAIANDEIRQRFTRLAWRICQEM